MLKQLLFFIVIAPLTVYALPAKKDTAVMFFNSGGVTVGSLDQAAYYMLIMPPTLPDDRYNIQEFYRNGKIKLIGKGDPAANSMRTGVVCFDGDCTMYFPDGNKSSLIQYKNGHKDGDEYLYYPNGKVLSLIKHHRDPSSIIDQISYWDCYDDKGNQLSKEGNGKWVKYDEDCHNIIQEGPIKNGYMDGNWIGKTFTPDTINYAYTYKRSLIQSSVGYDKKGKSYPFNAEYESATYRSGPLVFLERLRGRIKMPKDTNGHRMSIDTMHVSFIVERDGKLSEFGISGIVDQRLKDAIFAALEKGNEWIPSKVYGVPFRSRVILPMSEVSGWNTKYKGWESYHKEIWYNVVIVKD